MRDLKGVRRSRAILVERGSCAMRPRALRSGKPPNMMRLLETTNADGEVAKERVCDGDADGVDGGSGLGFGGAGLDHLCEVVVKRSEVREDHVDP